MKISAVALLVVTVACTDLLLSQHQVQAKPSKPRPPRKFRRPNILLLITDDQDSLLGSTDAKYMPFYHKHLVEQGTTFTNYFVHTPVCCPSRSAILTGRYIHNYGTTGNGIARDCYGPNWIKNNANTTFNVYAKKAGYRTAYSGKYLNSYGNAGGTDVPLGWDKWQSAGLAGFATYFYNYTSYRSDNGVNVTGTLHKQDYATDYFPDLTANYTLEVLRNFTDGTDDRPFLVVNAWTAPHGPFQAAPWAADLFVNETAPRTPNYNASDIYQQQKRWLVRQLSPIDEGLAEQIDLSHRLRLQTLASVDKHIDQFVTLLKERGALDNTIIIYTSDHGFQLGQHRFISEKNHPYESDIRVPFVVRGPNVPKNSQHADLHGHIDIAATFYQLFNQNTTTESVPLPETIDGIPFLPINNQPKRKRRTDFLLSYFGNGAQPCGVTNLLNRDGIIFSLVYPFGFGPCPNTSYFHPIDALNNTYKCLRTITDGAKPVDATYCEFEDSESFVEYYDNSKDPWQLHNAINDLTTRQKSNLAKRLARLKVCAGSSCRV